MISAHADQEAADEEIDITEIYATILNDEILSFTRIPDGGRSCLVLGFVNSRPIHMVCGWHRESVVIITVYIPKPPKFQDPWTRGR